MTWHELVGLSSGWCAPHLIGSLLRIELFPVKREADRGRVELIVCTHQRTERRILCTLYAWRHMLRQVAVCRCGRCAIVWCVRPNLEFHLVAILAEHLECDEHRAIYRTRLPLELFHPPTQLARLDEGEAHTTAHWLGESGSGTCVCNARRGWRKGGMAVEWRWMCTGCVIDDHRVFPAGRCLAYPTTHPTHPSCVARARWSVALRTSA